MAFVASFGQADLLVTAMQTGRINVTTVVQACQSIALLGRSTNPLESCREATTTA